MLALRHHSDHDTLLVLFKTDDTVVFLELRYVTTLLLWILSQDLINNQLPPLLSLLQEAASEMSAIVRCAPTSRQDYLD